MIRNCKRSRRKLNNNKRRRKRKSEEKILSGNNKKLSKNKKKKKKKYLLQKIMDNFCLVISRKCLVKQWRWFFYSEEVETAGNP